MQLAASANPHAGFRNKSCPLSPKGNSQCNYVVLKKAPPSLDFTPAFLPGGAARSQSVDGIPGTDPTMLPFTRHHAGLAGFTGPYPSASLAWTCWILLTPALCFASLHAH